MAERPTSPHLSVYRMHRYTLLTSVLNRATGLVLSLGLLVLVYWLMAVAGGPLAYGHAAALLGQAIFKILWLALLAVFAYHLCAGLRHLVWDSGRGLERAQSRASAYLVLIASAVLFAALAAWLLTGRHA
ncbi:MAG: succinate dehydrogenase, cytochrome b556 subunit [Steroidobacteraceae bacterium]